MQRNRRRRRLGGVCAGIADYLGVHPTVVRLVFMLSIFVSFSLTFWIYLLLWVLLPAGSDVPMPDVSWELSRELRRIDKRVRNIHRRLDPAVADMAQETFDAIKILAPEFERPGDSAELSSLREAALVRFPKLLDRLIALPRGLLARRSGIGSSTSEEFADLLLYELGDLRLLLQTAVAERIEAEFRRSFSQTAEGSPELTAWREQLAPLRERLQERAAPATVGVLQQIEEKLAFLLERVEETDVTLDLRPFEVRKIAFEYLPDTLNQYLQLSPALTRNQKLISGKTAEESLNEQLNVLNVALTDLAKSLFEQDAHALLVQGRFLKDKFAEQPFRLTE